jgi:hypothetical protein
MARARRFLLLSPVERNLLVSAALLLLMTGLGLRLLPSRTVRRLLALASRGPGLPVAGPPSPREIARAVTAASRHVPGATCLTQALVAQMLFDRQGYPARVWIGAARDGEGAWRAHAWLEGQSGVVIGGAEGLHYVPLTSLEARNSDAR